MSEVRPKAPDWLDRQGRKEWKKLADVLDRVPGLMKEPDWYLVAMLADSLAQYQHSSLVLKGKATDELKPHQIVRMKVESKNTILECLRQLGMTPMARRQLHGATPPKQAEDPLGAYMFKLQSSLD